MRKRLFGTVVSLILALTMVIVSAGCGEKTTSSNVAVDDGFFTDDETVISKESTGSSNADSKSGTESSNSGGGKITTPAVEGNSWKDVLKKMPTSLEGTTVTVYNWNPMKEYTGAPAVIKKFEKETGITVKWLTQSYNTYLSQMASKVASGQSPDVVRLRTPQPTGLVSLQPISASGYDFTDKAWDQQTMKDYTYNGKVFATSLANTHIGSAVAVYYNKSLISKYDLEDPYQLWKGGKWTLSKMLEMSRSYKKSAKADFAIGGHDYQGFANMYGVQGPIALKNGKFVNMLKDITFINVTKQVADWRNTESIYRGWGADEFNNSECLFWIGSAIYGRKNNAYFQSLKSAGSLNSVPCPQVDGQSEYYQPMGEYEAYGIAKGAKNATAVPYFLRYWLDPANYDMNSFFCSKQALEVYNWTNSQKNRIWETPYKTPVEYLGGEDDTFGKEYATINGSQMISFLDRTYSDINSRIELWNNLVTKLG